MRDVKHEVADEGQRERIHPAFFSLGEQWERFTQRAQRLPRRQTLVQLPEGRGVRQLRTPDVPEGHLSASEARRLKADLARRSGQPVAAMERALGDTGGEEGELTYYETASSGRQLYPPSRAKRA
jgi:hypothetical protein